MLDVGNVFSPSLSIVLETGLALVNNFLLRRKMEDWCSKVGYGHDDEA